MNCSEARNSLTAGSRPSEQLAGHLQSCPDCARFAARLDAAEEFFRGHHAGIGPDELFAQRVVHRLRDNVPVAAMGWAALRLLPLSLAASLILVVVTVVATPSGGSGSLVDDPDQAEGALATSQTLESEDAPTDDVLAWILEANGNDHGSAASAGNGFTDGNPDEEGQ